MDIFKEYASYYDLIYNEKDYASEVDYIVGLIKEHKPYAKTILNLGCGTGKHDILLEKSGYSVTGIDVSQNMINIANENAMNENCKNTIFIQSDIKELQLDTKFDVVISLFHVMSYQTTKMAIESAFISAREHLNTNGCFIFDFWYGPAVLTDLPTVRVKRFEDSKINIIRFAEPVLCAQDNVVDVNYSFVIENKNTGDITKKHELHKMRYFFDTDLELICDNVAFKVKNKYRWMTKEEPDFNSWNALWIVY